MPQHLGSWHICPLPSHTNEFCSQYPPESCDSLVLQHDPILSTAAMTCNFQQQYLPLQIFLYRDSIPHWGSMFPESFRWWPGNQGISMVDLVDSIQGTNNRCRFPSWHHPLCNEFQTVTIVSTFSNLLHPPPGTPPCHHLPWAGELDHTAQAGEHSQHNPSTKSNEPGGSRLLQECGITWVRSIIANHCTSPRTIPIQFRSGMNYPNLLNIQPPIQFQVDTRCQHCKTICTIHQDCLSPSHFNLEVLLNVLHCVVYFNSIDPPMNETLFLWMPKCHVGVNSMNRKEGGILDCFWCANFCPKLRQRQ